MLEINGRFNTTQLAGEIAKVAGISKKKALEVIALYGVIISNEVAKGNMVSIHNLGNFKPIQTAARDGHNPVTLEKIQIDASVRPHLTFAKYFKDKVRSGEVTDISVAMATAEDVDTAPEEEEQQQPVAKKPVASAKVAPAPKVQPTPAKAATVSAAKPAAAKPVAQPAKPAAQAAKVQPARPVAQAAKAAPAAKKPVQVQEEDTDLSEL